MKELRTLAGSCSIGLALVTMLVVAGCNTLPPVFTTRPQQTETPTAQPVASNSAPVLTSTPGDRWAELLQRTPYPYTAPRPPAAASPLDGSYAKVDPAPTPFVHCRRCPDYLPEGGVWKLYLDDGIYRIYYDQTGWRSLGSFTVSGDQATLFNDPNCTDTTGTYTWKQEDGQLTFKVVEDTCAIKLRAANLTKQPWLSCQPPNHEAGITDHWRKPPGC